MQVIRPVDGAMKIEHWRSQEQHREDRLTYSNLLAAWMGGDGLRISVKHCDTAKGNQDLSRNPANPDHHVEEQIHYLGDGTIS